MDIKKLSTQDPIEFGDGRTTENLEELKLDCTDKGIIQSLHNMATIMDGLKEWDTVFAYNELTEQTIVARPLPKSRGNPKLHKPRQLRDDDGSKVRMWFNRHLKWSKVAKNYVFDVIALCARQNTISPIRHYLEALPSMPAADAQVYLAKVLNTHFGLRRFNEHPDAIRYSELVFRKWLISAVARALEPACKADHVLILEGSQGAGKSTAIRTLCGDEYFGDTVPRLDSKDASDYVRGKWIIELAELSSVSKAEVEHVKAFITRTEEKFRPAYGRNEVIYQRRCVFVGTTNRTDYLRDETGNRRFWPIKIDSVDVQAIRNERNQIWRAAKALYDSGEQWWLTDEEAALAQAQQERRTVVDPLYEEVAQWLNDTNTEQTCMRAIMDNLVSSDGEQSTAQITPQLQHRIRGALNAAGYESIGCKFTSGQYKGMTIFEFTKPSLL